MRNDDKHSDSKYQNTKEYCEYCCYAPCKDFHRCLKAHKNASPSFWTREEASKININPDNTAPLIPRDYPIISPDLWTWDNWPLLEKDGSVAVLPGGWRVLFALAVPRSVLPGERNDPATIYYFYSRNGADWIQGGRLFQPAEALGARQWSGSAFVEDDSIYFFYTANGRRGETEVTNEQRIALAIGDVMSNLDGVLFDNWVHEIILVPDGEMYETFEQSPSHAFRDPWFFKDPATGCEYILFEGNAANLVDCNPGVPPEYGEYGGNVGIALLRSEDYMKWELLPPLIESRCVNLEIERPTIVVKDGFYYLFVASHAASFAPGIEAPDGLYGFVANSLRGNYMPLNDGGLVVANNPQQPYQAYSWAVLPDFSVISFIDHFNVEGVPVADIGSLPPKIQYAIFAGTPAPTLQLQVMGNTTRIISVLDYGLVMVSESESPNCNEVCCQNDRHDDKKCNKKKCDKHKHNSQQSRKKC